MLPSREQIEQAAYERWERRGRFHGADREDWVAAEMDTLFQLNYQTVAEFGLAEPNQRVLGDVRRPRCRFCEQSPPRAAFSVLRPAIPELVGNSSLFTRDLCDDCAKQFAETIDAEFARFWESLEALRTGTASFREIRVPDGSSHRRLQVADSHGDLPLARARAFQLHRHDRMGQQPGP